MQNALHKFFSFILGSLILWPVIGFTDPAPETESESESTPQQLSIEDVQRFSNAINQIKQYYVNSIGDEQLFDDAIRGMLEGLDPHSAYLDEEDFADLQAATSGEFGGLGIEVTMENGLIKVITPIDETPAQKAGIKSGDYIIRLNETPVKGMTLRDAVTKMRGKKGSTIDLTIIRPGETEPRHITLERDVIQVKSINRQLYQNKYGYIRITHFQALTTQDLLTAIAQLKQQANGKLSGLILDLRNNPGGLLDSAIAVSDAFIHNDQTGDEELIVYTEGRIPGSKFTVAASPGDILDGAPIVVLINEGSASGSEIVAGALRDNNRAILVGTKSFGKGSVQTVIPLDENHGIKLTTAMYFTPSGDSIQAKGIVPDILIENLTVPEQAQKDTVDLIEEADLTGHLEVESSDLTTQTNATTLKDESDNPNLLHTDYQLYQALNILTGLALSRD
ncbi:MAG: PDZ domain-containing protein [Legionellales bacterium]|nr:PDZ domain-containing protein [Legionellales bacterium]